jgi:hypothetical protein
MTRRIFTARDLAPLRKATERILEREPDAALVAAAAEPFKRRIPGAKHQERAGVRLPVEIETSTRPDGVPLHEIASAVQKEFPGVTGVSLTPGGVSLKFEKAPTAAQRRKINTLLSDKTRLESMKPVIREAPSAPEVVGRAVPEEELRRVLSEPETSDAAWLRAFRKFAVENLVEGPTRPPIDRPPIDRPPRE